MHFRLRYVMDGIKLELGKDETVKFAFGGTDAVVVRILRLVDESNPQKATLICEGTCEQKVENSVESAFQRCSAGLPLDMTQRSFFKNVLSKLLDYMQKTVITLRWRLLGHREADIVMTSIRQVARDEARTLKILLTTIRFWSEAAS